MKSEDNTTTFETTADEVTVETVDNEVVSVEPTEAKAKPSRREILSILSEAFGEGKIGKSQVQRMRADMGITQAYFTRKQRTKSERKTARGIQKASRRANRANTQKGIRKTGRK